MMKSIQPTITAPQTIFRQTVVPFQRTAEDTNSSIVTISLAGSQLSRASDSTLDLDVLDRVQTLDQLKEALKGTNFRNMSPEESAKLASALDRTGKFDRQAVDNFFIEHDTEEPLDKTSKVDVVEHFNQMLSSVEKAYKTDSDFAFGVESRRKGAQLLKTLVSWT